MDENVQHFQHIMFHYIKKGKNATETHTKKMCAVYGEGAVTDRTCQKWFAKFHTGYFSLDIAPQLGRPVEINSNQMEILIENNQCYIPWETADILKISKSINVLVKMKNVSSILQRKPYRLFLANPILMLNICGFIFFLFLFYFMTPRDKEMLRIPLIVFCNTKIKLKNICLL